jgi:signal transduction histidine kinase
VYNIAPDVAQAMHNSLRLARITLGIPTIVILVVTFYGGLRLSHKIFGPFIPFLRHVNELKSGNYASRVHLRDGDEFQDFKDALNELAVTLQKKG